MRDGIDKENEGPMASEDGKARRTGAERAGQDASGKAGSVVKQAASYLLVGGSSALIELVLFQGLYALAHLGIAAANIIAVVASTVFNFTVNRSVTFKSAGNPVRSLVLYLILFAFNMTFSTLVIAWLVGLGAHSVAAKLATMVCITLWNFALYRKVVFK